MTNTSNDGGKGVSPPPAGSSTTDFTTAQKILMSVLVLGLVFALTMVLIFHYSQSSDVTAVLGVVLPTLTLVLGGIAGNGAGKATGSAGKQAVQHKLDVANGNIRKAAEANKALETKWARMASELKTKMPSRAGDRHLFTLRYAGGSGVGAGRQPAGRGQPEEEPVVDLEDMDQVSASLASLRTLLEPVE
jgi:hypothetical protein